MSRLKRLYQIPFKVSTPFVLYSIVLGQLLKRHLITSRERLKSALYLRLKKCKVFKIVKRDPSGFLKMQFVAKFQKKMKGVPLQIFKNFRKKVSQSPKVGGESLIVPKN